MLLVKLKGLSGKQIAVDSNHVLFLEEADNDGKPVCNVHFANGRWVTACLTLDEVAAVLLQGNTNEARERVDHWRIVAEAKRQAQLDAEAAITKSCLNNGKYKIVNQQSEKFSDGTRKLQYILEPIDGYKDDDDLASAEVP